MLIFYDKEEMSAAEAAEYIGFVKGEYLAVDWERPVHTGAEIPWAVLMSSRSFHGGPKKYQVEFMEKSRDIRHWIIVILDVPPVFGPIVAKWKQINGRVSADILPETKNGPSVKERLGALLKKDRKKCLVIYKSRKEGAEQLTRLLGSRIKNWTFEAVPGESLPEKAGEAGRYLLLGREERDFWLPPVKTDSLWGILLFLDCERDQVYKFYHGDQILKRAVINMKEEGWEISRDFRRFVVSSIFFEEIRSRREQQTGEKEGERFVMWDRYGLPLSGKMYTEERMEKFLEQFQAIKKIEGWLERRTV